MLTKLVNWLMRIKSLSIKNFRGIEELTLDFNTLEPIVFIGANGAGKSSILDCISKLIRFLTQQITYPKENEMDSFEITDITNGFKKSNNSIKIKLDSQEGAISFDSELIELPPMALLIRPTISIDPIIESLKDKLDKDIQGNFPVAVYYPVNRSVFDIFIDSSQDFNFNQFSANKNSVSSKNINFKDFFEWFRNREDLEGELLRDNATYQDDQLKAVRQSITSILPDFSGLRVRRSPLRMTVEKQNQELIINQLSDGEKCLLALVGDLARRLAIANPGLSDPLQGTGVVLIDEIELHLHPGWQYEIIPALTRTFPNCQFIVTTHSPIVLSQVKPEGIFCLEKKDGKVIAYHPDSSYGRDSNRILEDLMGVPERPQVFKDRLRELFRFIDEGNLDKAKELQHQLEESIGSDEPEFARADILIRRQEILGR
jgi:predicted ATP-binding protein involved in virulence